jgi:hypothetical protein
MPKRTLNLLAASHVDDAPVEDLVQPVCGQLFDGLVSCLGLAILWGEAARGVRGKYRAGAREAIAQART